MPDPQRKPIRQPLVLPADEYDDVVVPNGWVEMTKEHWRMFLPRMYARLEAEGKLDEHAYGAAHVTAVEVSELMRDGFSEEEAWRAFRENIFLPSEYEQPDPWSLNLDPVPITQALTRVCGHYFDEGADYATWAKGVREDFAEEFAPYLEIAWQAVTGKLPENPERTVSWNDIRNGARAVFNVWVEQPEMKWARKAWLHLRTKGLTSYRTEADRTMVLVRLATLALMYREFCEIAFEENQGTFEWIEWDQLGIESGSLYQLVRPEADSNDAEGRRAEDSEEAGTDERDADADLNPDDALWELSQRVRPEIYEALKEGFGDDFMLLASLWRTPTEYDPRRQESDEEILNPADLKTIYSIPGDETARKLEAFLWVREGMCQLH